MLDTIIDAGEISPSSQTTLVKLLKAQKDFDSLTKMCDLSNLDPKVDAELANIPNPKVRGAWLKRDGRTVDEVMAMIRSEKRATVLAEIAGLELPDGTHARLLAASDSALVSLALLESQHAPAEVRAEAARRAAARDLNHPQMRRLRTELERDPSLGAPILEAVDLRSSLFETALSHAPTMTAAAWQRVVDRIELHLAEGAGLLAHPRRYGPTADGAGGKALVMCDRILSAPWADAAMHDYVTTVVERAKPLLVGADKFRLPQLQNIVSQVEAKLQGRVGRPVADPCAELLTRIQTIEDDETAASVLAEVLGYPTERRTPLLLALAARPGLSVLQQTTVLRHLPHSVRGTLIRGDVEYPPATQAAMALLGIGGTQDEAIITLALANVSAADVNVMAVVHHLVTHCSLSDQQFAQLPADEIFRMVTRYSSPVPGTADHEVRVRLGRFLAQALEGAPETVWQQVHDLAPSFPATLEALVGTCKATCPD